MSENQFSVQVDDLTKSYGTLKAISGLSFSILEGEIVGFLGPNGAGKSTTMRILTGILQATSGKVSIFGHSVAAYPDKIKSLIGYMPENNPLPEDLRVNEYLRFRGRLKGLGSRALRQAVNRVCETCELDRRTCRKPIRSLSKGFRQRVGIADTLLTEPKLIILDEPTIGLDPHQVRTFRALLDSLRSRHTVIISSHILPEIERICDRCIIINRGQLVACGTPGELRTSFLPGSTYEILIEGDFEPLHQILQEIDSEFKIEDSSRVGEDRLRRLLVSHPGNTNQVSEILANAAQQSFPVRIHGITQKEATLEDIFVAATRKEHLSSQAINQAA